MSEKKVKPTRVRKPGAGRKSLFAAPLIRLTIRIPQYQIDHLKKVAGQAGGTSSAARVIIDRDIDSHGPDEI